MRPYPDVPVGLRITDSELQQQDPREWSKGKIRTLLGLKEKGFTWAEIGIEMNVSRGALRKKYYKMRNKEEEQ